MKSGIRNLFLAGVTAVAVLALAAPAAAHVRLGDGGTGSKVIAGDGSAGSPKVIVGDGNAGSPKAIAGDSNAGSPKVIGGDSNAGSPKVLTGDGGTSQAGSQATGSNDNQVMAMVGGAVLLALAFCSALLYSRRRAVPA